MYRRRLLAGVRRGASGADVLRMHAISRIMLGRTFRNIQASWVKEGPKVAQLMLTAGANDLGGTLMNESISTSAGAQFGQMLPPAELRRYIRDLGRTPAQRNTVYATLKVYGAGDDSPDPLDSIEDADGRFGTYNRLVTSGEFRFVHPSAAQKRP